MLKEAMKGSKNPFNIFAAIAYKIAFKKENPYFFDPSGTLVFCGSQGNGKTISAVKYIVELKKIYPRAIIVTNVAITPMPFNALLSFNDDGEPVYSFIDTEETFTQEDIDSWTVKDLVFEYNGLKCLNYIENTDKGVIYLIDEFHLELNSLESTNIDIEVMTEISQQRKQRKHIVCTSQVFMRLAKPLREQIKNVVLTKCFFGMIQYNKLIDGEESVEKDGKLQAVVKKRFFWFHHPDDWKLYNTYAKMKRYKKDWKGRSIQSNMLYQGTNISVRSDKK